jgi:hypothetical protein
VSGGGAVTREEAEKFFCDRIQEAHEWAENHDLDAAAMCAEAALEIWREHLPEAGR